MSHFVSALLKLNNSEREETREEAGVRLIAIGAMANWQSALDFLTRVLRSDQGQLTLTPADSRVRDSFFTHLTRGHEPNAADLMLAHLAYPLRIQTVLTTNFDDLLEQAFARLQFPLTTFDVHEQAALPDAGLVLVQPSIVKLHGARFGL